MFLFYSYLNYKYIFLIVCCLKWLIPFLKKKKIVDYFGPRFCFLHSHHYNYVHCLSCLSNRVKIKDGCWQRNSKVNLQLFRQSSTWALHFCWWLHCWAGSGGGWWPGCRADCQPAGQWWRAALCVMQHPCQAHTSIMPKGVCVSLSNPFISMRVG